MSRPTRMEQFEAGDWERLQEAAEQFERAWRDHTEVDLASFLPPPEDPLYGAILEELVKTDLEIRRGRGQAVSLDYYLEKYPRLGSPQTLSARLIYEEYRVLRRFGEPLDLEHYRQRFPDQFAELQRLIEQQSLPINNETLYTSPPLEKKPRSTMVLQNGGILPVGEGYRLIECIGDGTFGEVWRVEAPGGFPAAIKIIRRTLDSEESQRELRALEVIKRLSHPHLLKTQAAWALQDRLIILMDLADCTLRDRLHACKAAGASGIPPVELLRYFQEAAEALDYLHSEGVLHRDVKPQNLLLCHGHVKVADFGLVRDQKQHQCSYSAAGTPGYMAPEAWRGVPCAAGDQYSLALTYAELRLGRWPFDASDPMSVMLAHIESTPDLSRLDEAEQDVLLRGMAKDPAKRFPTCQEFVAALRDAALRSIAGPDLATAIRHLPIPPTRQMPRLDTKVHASKAAGTREREELSITGTIFPSEHSEANLLPPEESTASIATPHVQRDEKAPGGHWQAVSKPQRSLFRWIAVVLLLLGVAGAAAWYVLHRPSSLPDVPLLPSPSPSGQLVRHVAGQEVVFVRIQPQGQPDEPFYLMQNKVSNRLFRAFARAQGIAGRSWQLGGVADGQRGGDDDELPVFRVTRSEAERCAAWLGGCLPTARQLDLAFGYEDGAKPDFAKDAAVNRIREGPRNIREAHKDTSPFGICDLSGNGREWTRDNLTVEGKTYAILRGRSYTAPKPLSFADLEIWNREPENCPVQLPDYPSWTTGFRIVLEQSSVAP